MTEKQEITLPSVVDGGSDGRQSEGDSPQLSVTRSTVKNQSVGQTLVDLVGQSGRALGNETAAKLLVAKFVSIEKRNESLSSTLEAERERRIAAETENAVFHDRDRNKGMPRMAAAFLLLLGPLLLSQGFSESTSGIPISNYGLSLLGGFSIICGLALQFLRGSGAKK